MANFEYMEPLKAAGRADQPREPSGTSAGGQFAGEKESAEETAYREKFVSIDRSGPVVLYHGTQTQALEAIKKEGLKPAGGKGGDAYAAKHQMGIGDQEASVFLTQWTETAEAYGTYAKNVNPGSKAVVLQITIPKTHTETIQFDPTSDPEEGAWKMSGPIPPSWIKVVESANYGEKVVVRGLESVDRIVYAVFVVDEEVKSLGGPGSGNFGHVGRPGEVGGSGGRGTQVGITSARPGTSDKQVEAAMHEFAQRLKTLPGVSEVSVVRGTGIFFGVAEPTWVTAYTGNGAARRLLAKTAERHNQDSVLVMKTGNTDAAVELTFDQKIGVARRDSIMQMMKDRGVVGGTWYTKDGHTVLRMASVKDWGGVKSQHLTATKDLFDHLSANGTRSRMTVHEISTEVIENKDYAGVQKGLADGTETHTSGKRRDGYGVQEVAGRGAGEPGYRVPGRSRVRAVADTPGSGGGHDGAEKRALGGPGSGRYPKGSGGVKSAAFKKWFGPSKVVDSDGAPLRVYHGTTHNIEEFLEGGDPRLNPESDWGSGVYFTNEQEDLGNNYAGEGPDLTGRIERRAEQIEQEIIDAAESGEHPEVIRGNVHEEALEKAREELVGKAGALSVPVYLSIQNPFVLGMGSDPEHPVTETFLTMDQQREDPDDEDSEYGEPTGTLVDFVEALRDEASSFHDTEGVEDVIQNLLEKSYDGGLSASELSETLKKSEKFGYMTDDEGRLVANEVFRRAVQAAGFDGVIDRTVWSKFGSGARSRGGMKAMSPATVHYIAFKPTQIKSAIGNRGTYDSKNPLITAGFRTAAPVKKKKIVPFDLEFDYTNPDVIEWAEAHAAELIDQITETTRTRIHDAVVRSFEEGDRTIAEKEILNAVGDKVRAKTIAHHESMLAANRGQTASWDQAIDEELLTGDELVEFIATADQVVCPICEELDRKTRTMNGEYHTEVGDYGSPPVHVNCRCTEGIIG